MPEMIYMKWDFGVFWRKMTSLRWKEATCVLRLISSTSKGWRQYFCIKSGPGPVFEKILMKQLLILKNRKKTTAKYGGK
jgi:hypothetical protein